MTTPDERLRVGPLEQFEQSAVAGILKKCRLRSSERALILCELGPETWWLVTNERLVWNEKSHMHRVAWKNIWSVRFGAEEERDVWKSLEREQRKAAVSRCAVIELIDQNDKVYLLNLEPGTNILAAYEAISSIRSHVDMQRRAKDDADAWRAHKKCIRNRADIEQSADCGCFYCLHVFLLRRLLNGSITG